MRHLISIALLAAAIAVYSVGFGPLFFGQPILGIVMVLVGLGLEAAFWLRLRRSAAGRDSTVIRHPGRTG